MPKVAYATPEEVGAAREIHCCNEIEIDEPARVSRADNGYWVQAWVWVDAEDDEETADN